MSKCRYDLPSDCNNKNCVECVLDNIQRDIFNACVDAYYMPVKKLSCDEITEIIDKYKAGNEG